jgi:catechol 2,3-dioxygenase-like lactoylglutathione lyase family enzyme
MNISSHYVVICTDKVTESRDFYVQHFGFELTFESDWYVSLKLPQQPYSELAILDYRHETMPVDHRSKTQGIVLNFEVDDVDQVFAQMKEAGLPIVRPIRDETFGQRHFITTDPNNILIDIITNIAPSSEFADQYVSTSDQ